VRLFPGAHMNLLCILFLSLKMGVTQILTDRSVELHATRHAD
jgi:hypothetical protein